MKLGSLFDGSGGFPLAGQMCGIEPVWASEIEPYPIAVTKNRFPNMKHYGDISKINGAEIEPVDIICAGSPCQDLSIAGLRKGIKHEANGDDETTRSGLFMESVRIIKEMREATNGEFPAIFIWENVCGAFSSNRGEDFRSVLEELIRIIEPDAVMPPVPKKGWAYADCYDICGRSLAYRTFDAQYWGVPQRRRRIHLVVDFRGPCASKILFEREGVYGYFEKGISPWQATSRNAENCVGTADREGKSESHITAYSFDSLNSNSMKSSNPHSGCREVDIAKCLDTTNPCPSKNQGGIAIVEEKRIINLNKGDVQSKAIVVVEKEAVGVDCYNFSLTGEVGRTLSTSGGGLNEHIPVVIEKEPVIAFDSAEVAYGISCRNFTEYEESYPTLCAKPNGGQSLNYSGAVRCPSGVAYEKQQLHDFVADYNANVPHQQDMLQTDDGVSRSLVAATHGAASHHTKTIVDHGTHYVVRRLTPTECARLQGFPDLWGHFPEKEDFTDEEYAFWLEVRNTHAEINGKTVKEYTKEQMVKWYNKLHTDSAEYKMWGNGIALPPAIYCMQGIVEAMQEVE